MLNKLLNDFQEKMVAEDISDNTIKNYVSDIKNFYKWYREIDFSENIEKVTHYHLNAYKDYLIHKSLFNASRLIVDNLAQREDYTQIIKIFHISLLYFPIGSGNGAIYHGKTIIHEMETNDKLSVHIKNQETGEVFDATNILPEYFYISVPLFIMD